MDEFKPEDELKPDTSDRRPQRSRKSQSAPKAPVSRQHMMMGIGILVLLLLAIGIGSALNSSPEDGKGQSGQQPSSQPGASGSDKNIDLNGSSPTESQSETQSSAAGEGNGGPQEISVPPVSSTPTEAPQVQAPANQQRVELPGDLNSALSSQQGQLDAATQGDTSSLPTTPATVAGNGQPSSPATSKPVTEKTQPVKKPAAPHKAAESKPAAKESRSQTTAAGSSAPAVKSGQAPGGNYTLQLSSASRSDTLNAWAKKQNLSNYHVYKTARNGEPWYVLVSGSYATPADAKRAVASLPAEVRAQKPWVKPVSQVKKESAK